MTQTTTTRSRLLPLVALGIASIATGATAFGLPLTEAAHAAPGDIVPADDVDLGTLAEGDPIPVSGGGSSSFDLSEYGVPAGTILNEGAPIEVRSQEDGTLAWSWNGDAIVDEHGYGPTGWTLSIQTPNGEVVTVSFQWDWSAADPGEEPTEEPTTGEPTESIYLRGDSNDVCAPGALSVPLALSETSADPDGALDIAFPDVPWASGFVLDEATSSLIITGYDPAAREGDMSAAPARPTSLTGTGADEDGTPATAVAFLGVWCPTPVPTVVLAPGDTATVRVDDLFRNLIDSAVEPGSTDLGKLYLEAMPDPAQGTLRVLADGVELTPDGDGGYRLPGIGAELSLQFEAAEGFTEAFSTGVTWLNAKSAASAPVTVTFEPVEPTPEEPTPEPEQPEPTPEPETPTPEVEVPRVTE